MGKPGDSSPRRRIDGSHRSSIVQPAPALPVAPEAIRAIAGTDKEIASEQLQRQAAQLGQRLRTQLRDIDARESEFHARVARMENELRTARLVFREREHAIEEQQIGFDRRLRKLNNEQSVRIDSGQKGLSKLPPIRSGFKAGAIPTATPVSVDPSSNSSESWRQRFQQRLQELNVQENVLQSRLSSVAKQQQELDEQREELENKRFEQISHAETDRKQARREFDQERLKLRKRADDLERRSIAVQEMQADTSQMHREALELRICAEGLIGELEETTSPVEIAERLATLRRQLDDQYKLANQSLREQQEELERLISKLAKHESRITEQREEVRGWVQRRQLEIEEQTKKLLQREQQLAQQEASFRSLEGEWQLQRDSYEQQIRRLKRQLPV